MNVVFIVVVLILVAISFAYLCNAKVARTHDFRQVKNGIDYIVDFAESHESAIVTTAMAVKLQEKIILSCKNQAVRYKVEAIQQYCNDDEVKVLLLKKIDVVSEEA